MGSDRLTRRECLARGAGAVLAAGLAGAGGYWLRERSTDAHDAARGQPPSLVLRDYFAPVTPPPDAPRISVAIADAGQFEALVRAAVGGLDRELGMRRFVGAGDVVLIKPNVGFDRPPAMGATTHPELVRWLVRLCRAAGAREVLIADHPIESPEACFARSGIARVAGEEGARIVLATSRHFARVSARWGSGQRVLEDWPVFVEPLRRATKLIGIAPVKDHNLSRASITLKNWYGLLGGRRNQLHQAIHEVISDLAVLFSPTLVIADGTRVMLANGPTGGRSTDVRPGGMLGRPVVVAATDPVACDAWCYENLLGRDPAELTYLGLARRKVAAAAATGRCGFGESDWRVYDRRRLIVTANV
jgi:uncharacterized protein (DUF362 family)